MRIYTYKQLYKPGKAITSVRKKKEGNINFTALISANAFQIKYILWLKKRKNISETSYPKIDITETFVIILRNIDNHLSIYINFSIFFWYITAQEVSFLEFPISRFCDRHIFSLFLTKHVELAQFLLFCNGTFTIFMLNFSI